MQLAQLVESALALRFVQFAHCLAIWNRWIVYVGFEYDSYTYSTLWRVMRSARQNAKHAWRFYANTCHIISHAHDRVRILFESVRSIKIYVFCEIKKNKRLILRVFLF